jgi:O-antigen ligase
VGGPDFAEANFFGAYMAVVLVIAGVMFMRSKWPGKVLAFLSGGFVANAIVLTRSRGTFVGMAAGAVAAVIMSPKKMRLKLSVLLILGGVGFVWLSDPQFIDRMSTIVVDEGEERDASAQSRIVLFHASLRMIKDRPWGVGVGNFYQTIGRYVPEYAGKDAHNTYVRCYTELGLQGFAVFVALIFSAFWGLRKTRKLAREKLGDQGRELEIMGFGLTVGLATLLGCFLTVSLTYVEFSWWFLMMPVCLRRAVENRIAETEPETEAAEAGNPLIPATARA